MTVNFASPTNQILDEMLSHLGLKNDAALSRALEVAPPVISKLRHARLPFGAVMAIRAHKLTGWPLVDIEKDLGVTF